MTIGLILVEILINDAFSLKEKRSVLKGLKDRVKNNFNVSIAEVGDYDIWNKSAIAIVTVSNMGKHVERTFNDIINFFDNFYNIEIINIRKELL
ncbi:MAG: DUF503 domain-containing protein [Deferribacterota bacterium]|nr:DUF503 domain-containing protein [Deferribacterota bacterium]